jgi:acetylornithine deacetylase/succinyl-diaminopimelate desuccinylase-like protein
LKSISNLIEHRREALLESLRAFLKMKSIAAQNLGMQETAGYLVSAMQDMGLDARLLTLEGAFPAVFGDYRPQGATRTLLIYGHYDVQPVEPLDLWHSDPFGADVRDGRIYSRGATDDKGNLWATLMAFTLLKEVKGGLPMHLKFFFEGEEEIGSPNLRSYLQTYRDLLAADYTILCDRGVHESGRPQMYLGNKGIMSVEIDVEGPSRDVHSGQAPLIGNPAWQLVRALASLKDHADRILIPGYYDEVAPPSEEEMELLKNIPFDEKEFLSAYGLNQTLPGTGGLQALIHLLYSPTATINGLSSGYQGRGSKTIIPARASTKLDFRFVMRQDPQVCAAAIREFFEDRMDGCRRFTLSMTEPVNPHKMNPAEPIVEVARRCAARIYGREAVVWPLLDGSGPMAYFGDILGAPAMIIGLGAPFAYANTHAPNEYIGVDDYLNGIAFMADIYDTYGEK